LITRRAAVGVGAVVVLVALASCAGGEPARPAASASPAGGTSAPAGGFNGTDVAWLQLTIAMNERILPVLDLAVDRAAAPGLRPFAAATRAAHVEELRRLRALQRQAALPAANPHEGHDMPGMVTAAGLAGLRDVDGRGFDRLFADALRGHLDQAARLAGSERKAGAHPEVVRLAEAIEQDRTAQRARLDALLSR
jgi:uncharacterized protein (DUF305 family)